jgi:hypothetical protein
MSTRISEPGDGRIDRSGARHGCERHGPLELAAVVDSEEELPAQGLNANQAAREMGISKSKAYRIRERLDDELVLGSATRPRMV